MPWVKTKIAQFRIKAGYRSGQAAADELGVSLIHIREIERGASGVSKELAAAMAKAYGRKTAEVIAAIRSARYAHLRRVLKSL